MSVNMTGVQKGIRKVIQNGIEYTIWTRRDTVSHYIEKFLKERFPGMLIVSELNQIDLTIPEENLPIEIQSTPGGSGKGIGYTEFESRIRKQIEQNVISYGRCWFFFDAELLRSMQHAGKSMSINMDWFRKFMKEDKLKAFTVSYTGIINELEYKNFDFLSTMSQTCKIASETDDMMLNNNKIKIFHNVVKGYGFTQDDIYKFENDYRKYCELNGIEDTGKNNSRRRFLKTCANERTKLYGNILDAVGTLSVTNDILNCANKQFSKYHTRILGIFELGKRGDNSGITRFVDKFDICKYFPGYLRNKEMWEKLKGHGLNSRQFENITKNGISDYFWYETDRNSAVAESGQTNVDNNCVENNNTLTDEETDKDKEVNFEIKSKGQIITVNIRKEETAGW